MIEKLDKHLASNINSCNMSQNIMVADKAIEKINEIIDTIYDMQLAISQLDPDSDWYDGNHIADTSKKVDPYAEQRKCICKLCWFWNDDKADKVIGILTGVFDEADRPFERSINQTLYKHCEPVKPDDDIIYKSGDNGL